MKAVLCVEPGRLEIVERPLPEPDGVLVPVEIRAIASDPTWITPLRDKVVADLVARTLQLLTGDATLRPRDGSAPRPVEPGDIAVVVDTNHQLDLVHDALQAAGVPSVRRTTSSVFKTAAGADWIVLLSGYDPEIVQDVVSQFFSTSALHNFGACERPIRGSYKLAFTMTPFDIAVP